MHNLLNIILLQEYNKEKNGDDIVMKKILYHGSEKIIEKPVYGFGKAYNDYGLGFYCTEELDMAKEWGVSREKMATRIVMNWNAKDCVFWI